MRFRRVENETDYFDVFLPRRSLYVMSGEYRFEWTHELLGEDECPRERRISIITRVAPRK